LSGHGGDEDRTAEVWRRGGLMKESRKLSDINPDTAGVREIGMRAEEEWPRYGSDFTK